MKKMKNACAPASWAVLFLGICVLPACSAEVNGEPASTQQAAALDTTPATTRVARELLPNGAPRRVPISASQRAALNGFDYQSTFVGTTGNVSVYYANSLGGAGLAEAQQLLDRAAAPYADMESIFGISGGAVSVVVAPLSAAHDGSGGAYHYGCDFTSGGEIYVDATFANTTVDPISWEVGLYVAELSEAFMGPQNKGWGCGSSNGEGLSRYLAAYEMAPVQIPSWALTAPSWASAGFPDWISSTEGTDRNYPSIGAAVAYINWVLAQGFSITAVTQAGGNTLSANYSTLTGNGNAYASLTSALSGIAVNSDNPWGVSADVGVRQYRGDFNGDNVQDVIIVTASGSYEYLGSTSGGFTADAWVRADLPLNAVRYYPGDFNGDHRTDLIIQTLNGSYEYLGNAEGGFTADVWIRGDLPLGQASYVPGDFDGDGVDDVIIVTASGSYEYLGSASGGFTSDVWTRGDLALNSVGYTAGDFNGDGRSDLIIQTGGGSYEYTGAPGGGFNADVWVRGDLPLGSAGYTVGDFNGDGYSDVIIQTSGGSYEYTGLPGGGFTGDVWDRSDLPLGLAGYTVGDFNGDGRSDLIIQTGGGSYEYTGVSGGGFIGDVWVRGDLPLGATSYTARDFNGDGYGDLIIQTSGGSYEYTGLPGGGFTGDVWDRSDLPIRTTYYY